MTLRTLAAHDTTRWSGAQPSPIYPPNMSTALGPRRPVRLSARQRLRHLPAVYWLYACLTVVQLVVFVLGGLMGHLTARGVPFMALLLIGLAAGSRVVWGLLVVLNVFPLVAIGGVSFDSSGGVLWVNVALMGMTSLALVVTLLLPAMRRHVGIARRRLPTQF